MNKVKVVAVSGASGCGKTSVIKQLSKEFDCPHLKFDDFVEETTYPIDMKKWLMNGANASEMKTPKLIDSLIELITQTDSRYIFIEEPFGKERDSISPFIDAVVLLDLPMEICLSRIIRRSIKNPSADSLNSIPKYLENYELDKALNEIFAFIDKANEYIQSKKPWETKDKGVLYELANAIKDSAILLSPFIPETSEKIAKVFNFEISLKDLKSDLKVSKIKKSPILFKKINKAA